MFALKQTDVFQKWRLQIRDHKIRGLIASRLDRLAFGHAGDVKHVGEGISELRIDHGPGFRIYFQRRGDSLLVLLCGGDKSTQIRDIHLAKRLAKDWSEEDGS